MGVAVLSFSEQADAHQVLHVLIWTDTEQGHRCSRTRDSCLRIYFSKHGDHLLQPDALAELRGVFSAGNSRPSFLLPACFLLIRTRLFPLRLLISAARTRYRQTIAASWSGCVSLFLTSYVSHAYGSTDIRMH